MQLIVRSSHSGPVADFLSNVQGSLMVLQYWSVVAKGVIIFSEITIGISFSGLVADFLSNV